MVRSLRLGQACERVRLLRCSHVKRVLTDTGGVWRAERRAGDVMSAREARDEVSRARHR